MLSISRHNQAQSHHHELNYKHISEGFAILKQALQSRPSVFKSHSARLLNPSTALHSLRMGTRERIAIWLWGTEHKDRSLLAKLDFTLLPYFSLIWFLFGVTRASYSSAYISGMKEALNFQGKEYNYMTTAYLVTYAVFQMPGPSLLTLVRPKYVFVAANVTWSVLTMVTFRMTKAWQIILLNAIEGGFSAIA